MELIITYNLKQKLKSLSERLKYLGQKTNAYESFIDQNIKSENLRSNLSFIIALIIKNLEFLPRNKEVFQDVIKEYNQSNQTYLNFEDFESIFWIRSVKGEIIIPELVRYFIWQVNNNKKENKSIEIPEGKEDLLRCLQIYYEKYFQDSRLTISKEKLESILNESAPKEVTIALLIQKGIIEFDTNKNIYCWRNQNEYVRHLRKEIVSNLWFIMGCVIGTEKAFNEFFKRINGTQIWIDNLEDYLNQNNAAKICEYAVAFLQAENDLIKSDSEFTKIWLDSQRYKHINLNTKIPSIKFNYDDTISFIESVNDFNWRLDDIIYYQPTRSYCFSLIRLIVYNESKQPKPYERVLTIFKDTSRPFLVWILNNDIPSKHPEIIPYLLTDYDLIALAFQLIDKITINDPLLVEQINKDKKFEESCEITNQLWIEMFDLILEQITSIYNYDRQQLGDLLGKILNAIAEKVFNFNQNNSNSVISHNSYRQRYDIILKKLSNKRISLENVYPKPLINPRLIFNILPEILNYLKQKHQKKSQNHNEYIHLSSGNLDLNIEMLRLAKLKIMETEVSKEQKEKVKNVSDELVSLLKEKISQFYSIEEIDVISYNLDGTEKKKVKRGAHEFGFEIIDWGYVYLHFQNKDFLKIAHNDIKNSLHFEIDSDKYNDKNRDQLDKIKLYLKSLMLAFISINKGKNQYEMEELPVKETLTKLENYITDFALLYSIDDLSNKRIDAFDEKFDMFGYNIYYQSLTNLFFKCVNNFTNRDLYNIIKEYFTNSIDISRMLKAINIIDSKEIRDIISKQIEDINIENFIKSNITINELLTASIEAVNSEKYWEKAKHLLDRIQEHYNRIKQYDANTINILFEINLLLAYKERNFTKLINMPIPPKEHYQTNQTNISEGIQQFYIAIYKLYNDKNYDEAISTLNSLLSKRPKNIRYAFHLYRAETLKAIESE